MEIVISINEENYDIVFKFKLVNSEGRGVKGDH